jgi:hypothetical protein
MVQSNRTLNILFGGEAPAPVVGVEIQPSDGPLLISDTDYSWSIIWFDGHGTSSAAAHGTFAVAILGTNPGNSADWHGAEWISSASNGSLSTYRTEFVLPPTAGAYSAPPTRARLYIVGLGYAKTWINGNVTDTHELGQYVTFEERVLYDCVDVKDFLRPGKNVLGVMLGHGWIDPRGIEPGVPGGHPGIAPRQFLLLLSVTAAGSGVASYFPSSTGTSGSTATTATTTGKGQLAGAASSADASSALTFTATVGPVRTFDMFKGEQFDGRVAAALKGWSTPEYNPSTSSSGTTTSTISTEKSSSTSSTSSTGSTSTTGTTETNATGVTNVATTTTKWVPAIAPIVGPAAWKSAVNAHHAANIIQTKEVFTPISRPYAPGGWAPSVASAVHTVF